MSNVTSYLRTIEPLNGTNYPAWREKVKVALTVLEYDLALRADKPAAPADAIEKWERADRMANMIIKQSISVAIPDKHQDGNELSAKAFLARVEENFKCSQKTYASTLIMKMLTSQYNR